MAKYDLFLRGYSEKLAPCPPFEIGYPMLFHQQATYEAIKEHDLVINTYDTGTGKTIASLLRLFDLSGENVLFIAPTNELIRQHAEDITGFVRRNRLDFQVLEVNSSKLKEMQSVDDPDLIVRNPKKLHELITNPRKYFPDARKDQPIIVVTNPDIFYLCTYFLYSPVDSRNLFRDFLITFDYIVIDEFHYYNPKQMANFLFFFIASQEYGYFDGTRKACLLSATPNDRFFEYIDRIGLSCHLVAPETEPPESRDYPTTPALTPLHLELSSESLTDGVSTEAVIRHLANGQDVAVLSGSLLTVNKLHYRLTQEGVSPEMIRRITGAVPIEERRSAARYPLVLATPTVDIGYNFNKGDKTRQNLDVVYFEASSGSELIQRLGRAGRVLGKSQTRIPSAAFGFVDGMFIGELEKIGKKEMTREEFKQVIQSISGQKDVFQSYISSWGVLEAFKPISELYRTTREDCLWMVDNLFNRVSSVFAPDGDVNPEKLRSRIRWFVTCENLIRIIDEGEDQTSSYAMALWRHAGWRYTRWRMWEKNALDQFNEMPKEKIRDLSGKAARFQRKRLEPFVRREYAIMKALFSFRDSFNGPKCNIYDPNHIFQSSTDHASYDLLHVLAGYEVESISKTDYKNLTGEWGDYDAVCLKVTGLRTPPAFVQYRLDRSDLSHEDFERIYVGFPTSLDNLQVDLFYRERGTKHPVALDPFIRDRLKREHVPVLITTFQNRFAMKRYLDVQYLPVYPLEVQFNDGRAEYLAVVGTSAYLVYSELRRHRREQIGEGGLREGFQEPTDDESLE